MDGLVEDGECDKEDLAYVVSTNDTVEELENADEDEEGHEDVNQLDALGSVLDIAVPYGQSDLLSICRVADGRLGGCGLCGSSNRLSRLRGSRGLSVRRFGSRRRDYRGSRSCGVLLGCHDQGVELGFVSCVEYGTSDVLVGMKDWLYTIE